MSPCYPVTRPSLAMARVGEPLPYQFEPQPSRKGDDIPVDVPNDVRIRRFAGCMECRLVRLRFYIK